jgi:hypothetical protein
LIQEWEATLDNLAKQFVNGIAAVDPKNGGLTCAQCDLQSVCRVAEFNGVTIDAGANTDADDATGASDD